MPFFRHAPLCALLALGCAASAPARPQAQDRQWLAGDHHVHSEWSVDWGRSTDPPTPMRGGDSPYSRTHNARQAQANGLAWMVHTDHGGPGHARVTRDQAWPALVQARRQVPGVIQFHGMEFNVPAGEHASLIIAPGPDEREQEYVIERDYSRGQTLVEGERDDGQLMLDALKRMRAMTPQPLMFVNHPSRTATGIGQWGQVDPDELRAWHDAAPTVLVGMEGAPGHQASPAHRGLYRNAPAPTLGGFDQMTAQVGGVWDQLLSEGQRMWITANSDSHRNQRDGGEDFDPGQYSKTYVWARHDAGDVIDGLRQGRIFTVTGDLIDRLELTVSHADDHTRTATMGGRLAAPAGTTMRVSLRVHQPGHPNRHGQRPALDHIELIVGSAGASGAPVMQTRRFDADTWRTEGAWRTVSWELPVPAKGGFVRARGTSTAQVTPSPDAPGEDPWEDLWFYSNPVFVGPAD